VFERATLRYGQTTEGPALIEEDASVTVVESGHRLRPHPARQLLVDVAQGWAAQPPDETGRLALHLRSPRRLLRFECTIVVRPLPNASRDFG
jgi:hypothetical protein